ncbi:MAG: hypothetical protein ACO3F9_02690 [Burkholderiales bacterium]
MVAHAQNNPVVAPHESVAGHSQGEWSRLWWQWAASFEAKDSSVADRTGALCAGGQRGPVWFLAGTFGTQRTVRTCTVPQGKHLFFPLINHAVMPTPNEYTSCAAVRDTAAKMTDKPAALVLDINGQRIAGLQAHRQAPTKCFDMGARTGGRVRMAPSAANGYYVMLKPLPRGKHVLNFGGRCPACCKR